MKKKKVIFHTTRQVEKAKKRKNIIIFSVSAFLLCCFAFLLILAQYDYDLSNIKNGHQTAQSDNFERIPTSNGPLNLLFYGMDDDKNEMFFTVFVNVNLQENKIIIFPYSTNSKGFSVYNKKYNASECYNFGGGQMLIHGSKAFLGTKIDKYIGSTQGNMLTMLSTFESITVEVEKTVTLSRKNEKITFENGTRFISGEDAMKYLTYSGWENNTDKLKAQANVIMSMFKQYINSNTIKNRLNIFSNFVNFIETDISIVDFKSYSDALKIIAEKNSSIDFKIVENAEAFIAEIK